MAMTMVWRGKEINYQIVAVQNSLCCANEYLLFSQGHMVEEINNSGFQ